LIVTTGAGALLLPAAFAPDVNARAAASAITLRYRCFSFTKGSLSSLFFFVYCHEAAVDNAQSS
jgi:hypothetical protein